MEVLKIQAVLVNSLRMMRRFELGGFFTPWIFLIQVLYHGKFPNYKHARAALCTLDPNEIHMVAQSLKKLGWGV